MRASEDTNGHSPGGPLVDPTVLSELAEDVGPRAASSFAQEYAVMWPRRRSALAQAVANDDGEAAMDVILSVRVSSAMVGARRLEDLAAGLESRLRAHGVAALRPFLDDVERCGNETARVLAGPEGHSGPRGPRHH
ncbi:Hpt domain-containing protein [Sinomonas halotolerans]|uniref:Hpt domain-containing protein n=1 Tax=Sinomonas halotolerans TaxID=1644133 RepID=A0ABU9WZE8_9MICC